jgi:hypothetical protein
VNLGRFKRYHGLICETAMEYSVLPTPYAPSALRTPLEPTSNVRNRIEIKPELTVWSETLVSLLISICKVTLRLSIA